jgi:hypothetical protein
MFEPLVVGEGGVAAIVTYSDQIKVWQDFTHSADDFTRRMRKIEPDGDSRTDARLNDAVLEAVKMFADRPKFRRVLVVIGESRDRGSQTKLEEAVTKAQAANVTIYPVNYSVYKTSYTSRGDERFAGSGSRVYDTDPGNLLMIFTEIARLATDPEPEVREQAAAWGDLGIETRVVGVGAVPFAVTAVDDVELLAEAIRDRS